MVLHLHKNTRPLTATPLNLVEGLVIPWEVYSARHIIILLVEELEVAVRHTKLFLVLPEVELGPVGSGHICYDLLLLLLTA